MHFIEDKDLSLVFYLRKGNLLVLFAIVVYNWARHSVAERLSPVVLIIVKKI